MAIELLESVDPPPSHSAAEQWAEEIRRRVDEIEDGSVELEDWEAVRARLHTALAK